MGNSEDGGLVEIRLSEKSKAMVIRGDWVRAGERVDQGQAKVIADRGLCKFLKGFFEGEMGIDPLIKHCKKLIYCILSYPVASVEMHSLFDILKIANLPA